jgi:hypothetical protein
VSISPGTKINIRKNMTQLFFRNAFSQAVNVAARTLNSGREEYFPLDLVDLWSL